MSDGNVYMQSGLITYLVFYLHRAVPDVWCHPCGAKVEAWWVRIVPDFTTGGRSWDKRRCEECGYEIKEGD